MLQNIREKTSGWFATVILGLVIVTMAVFGIESYMTTKVETYVARVEGPKKFYGLLAGQFREIDQNAFRTRLELVRRSQRASKGKDFDAAAFESVANKRLILDQLVDEALLALVAERDGIVTSKQAVQKQITDDASFKGINGKFDRNQYQMALQSMRMTPKEYEQQVRENLVNFLLPTELAETEFVGNAELDGYLKLSGQTRDVRFLDIPPPAEVPAPPSEAQLKAWYDSHASRYRSPEQVAVEYVELDASQMTSNVVADEDTLRKRYTENKLRYGTDDQRLASHILVALPAKASAAQDSAALAKARSLATRARQPGADFAALAKSNSDDVGSRDTGGDLGPISKGVFEAAFDKVFFAMKPGQVSDPVKLADGYHVILFRELIAGDAKPFEAVRAELEAEFQESERERLFNDLGSKLVDKVYDDPNSLAPQAKELGIPVHRTSLFSRDNGDGIAALAPVRKAAFADAQRLDRQTSELVEIEPNHSVMLRVVDYQPSKLLALSAVHERVFADLVADRVVKAAQARAEAILARAKKGENIETLASELGHPASSVPGITRQAPSPQVAPLVDAAFRLPRPIAGGSEFALAKLAPNRYALVTVTAVKDGDLAGLDDATRKRLREQLARARGAVEARAYMQGLRKQFTIKVAEDRL